MGLIRKIYFVTLAGISPDVLDSLDEENLILMIKLLTMFGQALGTAYMEKRSARAFEDALAVSIQDLLIL